MDATARYLLDEKVKVLDKKATDMAQKTYADFEKALPQDEREKGLQLFSIVDQSMKKLKRVKGGRISKTKPMKTKRPAAERKHNKAARCRLKL